MPPSIQPGNDVNDNIIEVLISVASFLHPDAETIAALSPQERARWTKFQDAVVKGHYSITDLMTLLKDVVRKQSDAELEHKRQHGRERQEFFEQRLAELKGSSGAFREERKRVMNLITLCVIALVLCACLTAVFAKSWVLPGAGACAALVAAIGLLAGLRAQIARDDSSQVLPRA